MEDEEAVTGIVEVDRDLQAVIEFMQANIRTGKLAGVADQLQKIAPLLWGEYQQEGRSAGIRFSPQSPRAAEPQTQSSASE